MEGLAKTTFRDISEKIIDKMKRKLCTIVKTPVRNMQFAICFLRVIKIFSRVFPNPL